MERGGCEAEPKDTRWPRPHLAAAWLVVLAPPAAAADAVAAAGSARRFGARLRTLPRLGTLAWLGTLARRCARLACDRRRRGGRRRCDVDGRPLDRLRGRSV